MSPLPHPIQDLRRRFLARAGHRHGLPIREGNAVALLEGGGAFLEAATALIRGARHSLSFEMYIWADDPVGRRMAALLAEARARGVRVRGLVDAIGSMGSGGMIEAGRAAGLDLRWFHPVGLWRPLRIWNRRNHRKVLVADGAEAVVGSANWGGDYDSHGNPDAFLDLGVVLRGPSVADLVAEFERLWQRCGGQPVRPGPGGTGPLWEGPWIEPVTVQVVTSLSRVGTRAIRRHLELMVRQAGHTLWIANAYFIPGRRLLRLLRRAARRGVDLRILVPGHTDQRFVQAASRHCYGPLLDAGARILERRDRMLHTKAVLMDGEWVVVGTANLDPRSFRHNLELNLALQHPELASTFHELFLQQADASDRLDGATWGRRPWWARLWSSVAYACRWWL